MARAPTKGKQVTERSNTMPVDWRARAKLSTDKRQKLIDSTPDSGGSYLSLKGGVPMLNGNKTTNPVPMVILAVLKERTYFEGAYTGEGAVPTCYARYEEDADAEPHPSCTSKQSDTCASCEHNEFGTAENGVGKACKETLRMAFVSSDEVRKGKADSTPIVSTKLSVTNRKPFLAYSRKFDAETPYFAVETLMEVEPHPKNQYAVGFQRSILDVDDETFGQLSMREEEAEKLLTAPYPPPREKAAPKGRPSRFAGKGKK